MTLKKFHVQYLFKVVPCKHNAKPLLLLHGRTLWCKTIFNNFFLPRYASSQQTDGLYIRILQQFRFESAKRIKLIEINHGNLILVESHILIVNVMELLINNTDTNNQRYRNYKLTYDEGL